MAFFREETRAAERLELSISPRKFVLRGRVVTLDMNARVIPDGCVYVQDDQIVSVCPSDAGVPPSFQQAPVIRTGGSIFPGLIELHNHPAYNAIPLWGVPKHYLNRGQWRGDVLYERKVKNPAALLTHHPQEIYPKSVARFVECRALLGGVTTTQGLTLDSLGSTVPYYEGLVRSVEFSYGANWPVATDHINDFKSFDEFQQLYGPIINDRLKRLLIHLCEGTDSNTQSFFSSLIDPHGNPLIGKNLVAIHGTALGSLQFDRLKAAAGLIWSPTSNFLLYGQTTDVKTAKAEGVSVALGCDWAPSGTKNLLGELKIAKVTSQHLGGLFSDEELVRMVTTVPAGMIGWDSFLGSIETGKQADLVVIAGTDGDPYANLIGATETDIAVVVIGGRIRAGRASLVDPTTPGVELIHVANQSMVLDLIDDPNHPLAHVTLQASIATLSYALEHLPDLAKTFQAGHSMLNGADTRGRFLIRLEMDEESAVEAVSGTTKIGPGDVDPMELDPITAVDDATFIPRLKSNQNVPQWLKNAL